MERRRERKRWRKMIKGGVAICHFTLIHLLALCVCSLPPSLSSLQHEGMCLFWPGRPRCRSAYMIQRLAVTCLRRLMRWIPENKATVCDTCKRPSRPGRLPRSLDSEIRFGESININLKERESEIERERE